MLSSHPVKDSLGAGHVVLTKRATSAILLKTQIIRAYRFNEGADGPVKVWQMNDGVADCSVDTLASFSAGSPAVTDLDGNGLLPKSGPRMSACARATPSPADLSIVMHEGSKRHVMRGLTLDQIGSAEIFSDDDGLMDQAFLNAPKVIRDYAQSFWYRNRFAMRPSAPDDEEQPSGDDEFAYPAAGEGGLVYTKEEKQSADGQTAVLRVYRFTGSPDSPKTVWQIEDGPAQCGAGGASADFFAVSPILTDLDGNGIDEVWTGYTYGCAGASGPADLKIVMYGGEKRYAMNGKLSTASASGALQGDEGVMDQSFKDGPSAFRSLASKLWQGWRAGIAR